MPNKSLVRATLTNKEAGLCLIWATLQQLVVAASTYFIIEAIQHITENRFAMAMQFSAAFVASLVVVFLPNTISVVYLQKWQFRSFRLFVEAFIKENCGLTTWAHSREKSRFESWLTNESSLVYRHATDILYQAYSILISSVLNILVISVAIDKRIIGWYMAAAAVLFVSNMVFQKRIKRVSLEEQRARKDLGNVMLLAWENIFTGNRHCLENWKAKFIDSLALAGRSTVAYDLNRSLISSATVSLALLVIALGNGIYLFENQTNLPMVAGLLITLPRQLQIIQNIFAFFNTYLSWLGVVSQLKELTAIIGLARTPRDLQTYIQWPSLSFSDTESATTGEKRFDSLRGFLNDLGQRESGRLTLRGNNGSGKSTLLSLVAETTGEASFYLPSNFTDLAFSDANLMNYSDGNRVLAVFREMNGLSGVKIVLLDEWDANLDCANLELVDAAITELARSKIVIESRHRA